MSKNVRRTATLVQARLSLLRSMLVSVRGIFLIPLYVRMIGPEVYGLWLASGGVLTWLTMLDLGLVTGLNQRMASSFGQGKPHEAVGFLLNGFLIYSGLSAFVALVGIVFSAFVPKFLGVGADNVALIVHCFQIAVFASALRILSGVFRVFCLSALRPTWPLVATNAALLLGTASTVVLLLGGFGLWALPIGMLITEVMNLSGVGLIATSIAKGFNRRPKFDKKIIADLWRLTPSLFGSRIGTALVRSIEPTIITVLVSPIVATSFVVTRRAADIVTQTLQIGVGSTFSGFAHLVGEGNVDKAIAIADRLVFSYVLFGSVGYSLYVIGSETFVGLWVGNEAFLGTSVVVFVALSLFIRTLAELFAALLTAMGDVAYASWGTLFEAGIRLVSMYVFVAMGGVVGAPIGMLLTCVVALAAFMKRFKTKMRITKIVSRTSSAAYVLAASILVTLLLLSAFPQRQTWVLLFLELAVGGGLLVGLNLLIPYVRGIVFLLVSKTGSRVA